MSEMQARDDGFDLHGRVARAGIADEEILEMIRGRYLMLGRNNIVLKYHESRMKYVVLHPISHWKSGRQQFNICRGDRQRKIGANRLLWMMVKHEPIPEGMDVDHEDKDRFNDNPSNLRLRDSRENQCDNVGKRQLEDAMDFFDQFIPGA